MPTFNIELYTNLVRELQTMKSYPTVASMGAATGGADPEFFWVESTRDVYVWDPASTVTADGRRVVQLANAMGRAVRMRIAHPKWLTASEFWIDPASGSDANTGITLSSPIKTIGELCDRLGGQLSKPVTVWFLSKPASTDPLLGLVLSASPDAAFSTSPVALTIRGVPTTLATGTISTITAENAAANTPMVITDTSIASFSAYVGRRIRITSGARAGRTAIIVAAPSANTAWITRCYSPDEGIAAANFAASDPYVIESMMAFTGEEGNPNAALLSGALAKKTSQTYDSFQVEYRDIRFELVSNRLLNSRISALFNSCDIVCSGYNQFSGAGVSLYGCTIRPGASGMGHDTGQPSIVNYMTACGVIGGGADPLFCYSNVSMTACTWVGAQFYQDIRGTTEIFTSGFFNCTAADGSIVAGDGGEVHLSGVYGSGNTCGVHAVGGGNVYTSASSASYITGSTYDLRIDASSQVLPSLEPSAGGTLPALVNMSTWAHYAARSYKAFGFGTGSSITNKQY